MTQYEQVTARVPVIILPPEIPRPGGKTDLRCTVTGPGYHGVFPERGWKRVVAERLVETFHNL